MYICVKPFFELLKLLSLTSFTRFCLNYHLLAYLINVCWVIFHAFLCCFFFKINFLKKSFMCYQCPTVWIQSRTNVLILVVTVCKGYQLATEVVASQGIINVCSQGRRKCAGSPETLLKAYAINIKVSITSSLVFIFRRKKLFLR